MKHTMQILSILVAASTLLFIPATWAETMTVYSGRTEDLIGPILESFEKKSGHDVQVRYGKTAQMAATILEEGKNSPADVFIAQDAGALGALANAELFRALPNDILSRVDARFRSATGSWVGLSGRARVVVYNTENVSPEDLPNTMQGFCDPKWKGRIGWAPANGSFQSFVTALRKTQGEEAARNWLTCIQANEPNVYPKNTPIVAAAGAGEIDVGFVNHYYLHRFLKEHGESFKARVAHPAAGDAGALINVAGAGILKTSAQPAVAEELLRFLLSDEAQTYFTTETYEYPLVDGVPVNSAIKPLADIKTPALDLGDLNDLQGTLNLLQSTGTL